MRSKGGSVASVFVQCKIPVSLKRIGPPPFSEALFQRTNFLYCIRIYKKIKILVPGSRTGSNCDRQPLGIRRCYVVDAGFPINPNEGSDILLTFPSARVRERIRRL